MSDSLSVLLPVFNVQKGVARMATDLLDVLPDLTSRFELLIVDDASTDATCEAAHELASRFPQIRTVRNSTRLGRSGLSRIGLTQTRGERLLICDEGCQLDVRDLHKLWRSRHEYQVVLAWPAEGSITSDENWAHRVRAWRMRISQVRPAAAQLPGYQLVRREALARLQRLPADRYELLAELTRQGQTWQVVDVRSRTSNAETITQPGQRHRIDAETPRVRPAAKAGHFHKPRNFALGE